MCRAAKKWVLKAVVFSFLICNSGSRANPDLATQIPNAANWINLLFQVGSSLGDVVNPTNWVIYSAAGTYFYYQHILKGSLRTARSARDLMLMQLRETTLSIQQKEKLISEIDLLISELEEKVKEAERAFQEIPQHYQRLNRYRRGNKKSLFLSIQDYAVVEEWLNSREGQVFLESEKGQAWKAKYETLKFASSKALDEPLKQVIDKANEVFDGKKADLLISSTDPADLPGTFKTENNFSYQKASFPLRQVGKHISGLRNECAEALSGLVNKQKRLTKESNYFRFWTRPDNLKPSLVHGIVASAGAGGTYWLYRAYQFEKRKKEAEDEAKLKGDGSFDLGATLRMAKSRDVMQPYYQSIRLALTEHQNEIVADFQKNLSIEERSGIDIKSLVDSRLKGPAFDVAVETATLAAAKTKLGDRTSFSELQSLVEQIKTESGLRDGLFRPFNKAVIQDVINSLWSELTDGRVTDKISHELIRKVLARSEALFIQQPKKSLQASAKLAP